MKETVSYEQLPLVKGSPKVMKHTNRVSYSNKLECKHVPQCTTGNGVCSYLGQAGAGKLERKASGELVYHTPWLRKPARFAMVEPKARVEDSTKALKRLRAEFQQANDSPSCVRAVSERYHAQGYELEATNGHWALMVKANT